MKKINKRKKDKWFITFIILDVLALICFLIVYGPFTFFRSYWITTSMKTQTHQYLAYIFYNDKMIEEVMSDNYVANFEDKTVDTSQIVFKDPSEVTEYSSIYEEQVLKKDEGNELYKLINIEHNGINGYLLVVYDPSRLSLVNAKYLASGGQHLSGLCKSYNAIAGINASGFISNSETYAMRPMGTIIQNGKITSLSSKNGKGDSLIGFNYDNVLVLTYEDAETAVANGMRDALSFGPFLIMNGEAAFIRGNGGWGYRPRTAIGQRKDGIVLLLVMDGIKSGTGASVIDLTEIMMNYGAYNAANLDGGGSSVMVVNNEVVNNPGGWSYRGERSIPNAWILK